MRRALARKLRNDVLHRDRPLRCLGGKGVLDDLAAVLAQFRNDVILQRNIRRGARRPRPESHRAPREFQRRGARDPRRSRRPGQA